MQKLKAAMLLKGRNGVLPTGAEIEAQVLENDVKSTNNGYLFACNEHQLDVARANPERFEVYTSAWSAFPFRIALREPKRDLGAIVHRI